MLKIRPLLLLAAGGMGEVWLGRADGADGFHRALVVKRALASAEAREALLDEARVVSALSHPNVVHAYALVEDEEGPLLAMEHLAGLSLRALLAHLAAEDAALPVPLAARIVADAARGLDHAHRARMPDGRPLSVVHGDVSPENLVVTETGITKVIDFGIARSAVRARSFPPERIEGRPEYLAPEQRRGETPDWRADVYALGVVLEELVAPSRPYVAPAIEDVNRRMLAPEPSLRAVALADVADTLERAVLLEGGTHAAVAQFLEAELGSTLDDRRARLGSLLTRASPDRSHSFGTSHASTVILVERLLDSVEVGTPTPSFEPHPRFGADDDQEDQEPTSR